MPDLLETIASIQHPSDEDLVEFGRGNLWALDETVRIERHLTDCTVCRDRVAAAPADRVVQLIAGVRESAPTAGEPSRLRVVAGYEILDQCGSGGMGVVYRSRQIGLDRIVALKRLRVGTLATGEDLARFRREAVSLARLHHPHIVEVFDAGDQDGHPYLALEYVEGPSLRDRLNESPFSARDAARLLATLAEAVDFAHVRGIVHRDLKPGNVLLAHSGVVPKITDFGLAKLLDVGSDADETRTGSLLGTPGYMAPELSRREAAEVGPAVDIYSLGAILYELLTGRPPFHAATPFETIELSHTCDPVPPRRLQPRVPADLETICLKCLRYQPTARYSTARALADDLHAFLDGRPIAAHPATLAERLRKWVRRRPAVAALYIFVGMTCCAAAAGLTMHQQKLERQTRAAERNYRDAWRTLQAMLVKLDDARWRDTTQQDRLRHEQLHVAIPFFERILAETSANNSELRADRIQALWELSRLYLEVGRPSEAEKHLREAIGSLAVRVQQPDPLPDDLHLLAECHFRAAILRTQAGDPRGSIEQHLAALGMFDRAITLLPARTDIPARMADCHQTLGCEYQNIGELDEAAEQLQRAVELRQKVCAREPGNPTALLAQVETRFRQVDMFRSQNPEAASAALTEAGTLLESLSQIEARSDYVVVRTGALYLRWGQLLKPWDESRALETFERALRILEAHLRREPDSRMGRWHLCDVHAERAFMADQRGRSREAIADWDRAVELAVAAGQRHHCVIQRLRSLIECPLLERADAELATLWSDPALTSDDCFYLARCPALMIGRMRARAVESEPGEVELSEQLAGLSVRLLREARDRGFFTSHSSLELIEEHSVFAPLRERDDFQSLLIELSGP